MTHSNPVKPRSNKAGRAHSKPILPPRVAELMAAEIARAFAGEVHLGAASHRRLMQVLEPHEAALTPVLCQHSETLPDGVIRLRVPRNFAYCEDAFDMADPKTHTVTVEYDPRSGHWTSEVAAGAPGFDRLCAHVWRIQGRSEGMAARNLYALIGAAYVASLAEVDAS